MPQLLIRNVPEETHARIAASAAAAGRSVQAELLALVQERYAPQRRRTILDILLSAGGDDGAEICV